MCVLLLINKQWIMNNDTCLIHMNCRYCIFITLHLFNTHNKYFQWTVQSSLISVVENIILFFIDVHFLKDSERIASASEMWRFNGNSISLKLSSFMTSISSFFDTSPENKYCKYFVN